VGNEPTAIAGPVEGTTPGTASFSVSQNGVLVYQPSTVVTAGKLVWHDRAGRALSVLGDEADYSNLELSPDGSQLLVAIVDPSVRTRDIWVVDVARGVRTRVTFDPSEERSAIWMPDGRSIVYTTRGLELYTKTIGGGSETPLLINKQSKDPRGVSPDGKFLLYRESGSGRSNDLWIRPLQGDPKPVPLVATPYNENGGVISPDGHWLAYESDETGRPEIYVTAFPSGAGKWLVSTAGGSMARWRRDGREMFYIAPDNMMMSVKVNARPGAFTIEAPVPLFRTMAELGPAFPYDVSPDGERFIINDARRSLAQPSLTIVFNWPELLKQSAK
jgi:dipeptidyl aminopeptidase/acylaminoacyl peptidase